MCGWVVLQVLAKIRTDPSIKWVRSETGDGTAWMCYSDLVSEFNKIYIGEGAGGEEEGGHGSTSARHGRQSHACTRMASTARQACPCVSARVWPC